MANILKGIGALFYSAGDVVEKKSEELKMKHKEEYERLKVEAATTKEQIQQKLSSEIASVKEQLGGAVTDVTSASKRELRDLKSKLDELSVKIDMLLKEDDVEVDSSTTEEPTPTKPDNES